MQQGAVDHYRIHGNETAAYRHAFNCEAARPTTVYAKAYKLFNLPHIVAAVEANNKIQAAKIDISENRVLAEMAAMGFSNAANLFDDQGTPKNIANMDIATQRAIKSVTVKRYTERTGSGPDDFEEVEIQKIELHPKLPALIKLAEIKGLAQEVDKNMQRNVEVTVNISGQTAEIE